MDNLILIAVLGFLILFGALFFIMIRAEKKARQGKQQIALSLGFSPIEAPPALADRFNQLYQNLRSKSSYEVRNLSHKRLPDGDMYLFDLVETSGEDDSYTEDQSVAILSPCLKLPDFVIFPKVDMEGIGAKVANRLLQWVLSKVGNPVEFPQFPEFQQRYLVSSADPEKTRNFLDSTKIWMLSNTQLCSIHAGGDLFTFSKINLDGKTANIEAITERINQAIDLFQIFTR